MANKAGGGWGTNEELSAFKGEPDAPETPVETTKEPSAASGGPQKPTDGGSGTQVAEKRSSQPSADSTTHAGQAAGKTAEQIAAAKRWKLKGKVAGEDKEWEVGEDDFDEAKNPEGHKRLRDVFQKAEDYDRPGGALDKAAQKKAQALYAEQMVKDGLWVVVDRDGKKGFDWSPRVSDFRKWQETQKAGAAAPAAPAQAQGAEKTPRQVEIAGFATKFAKEGLSSEEVQKWQELVADERLDVRDREKEQRASDASRKQAEEATARKTDEDNTVAARKRITDFVASLEDKFKDPLTGKVNPHYVKIANEHMERTAVETQDWAKAEGAAREFAEAHASQMKAYADALKVPRAPTAPPPAPVLRGGQTAGGGENGNGRKGSKDFDPRKGFGDQGATFDEYVRSTAGRE